MEAGKVGRRDTGSSGSVAWRGTVWGSCGAVWRGTGLFGGDRREETCK